MTRKWIRAALLAILILASVHAPPAPVVGQDATAMDCTPVDYQGPPATISFVWWTGGGDTPSDVWVSDAIACFNEKYAGTLVADL